jgi:hypothetical protein
MRKWRMVSTGSLVLLMAVLVADTSNARGQDSCHNPEESKIVYLELDFEHALQNLPPRDLTRDAQTDAKGRCAVHHLALTRVEVPIVYGMRPGLARTARAYEERHYPNARMEVEGGCIRFGPKTAIVLQCKKCLAKRARKEEG